MIAPATNQQQLENGANAHESLCNDPIKEIALRELCSRTGYQIKQENGQRKYGGPPPGWNDVVPGKGCELFVGKLPRDLYEDELVPVLEKCGSIYELRLMMDFNGNNRGFAFVKYTTQNEAKRALRELNNHEIRKGRLLGVCKSVDNCRLFVGGIPKTKQKEEILVELQKLTEGVVDVIVYPAAADKTKNRGFAFVEFQDHHTAAMARRKLMHTRPQVWGHPIAVDWAEPEVEVDDDVMSQVKILYVRNLMLHTTEEQLEKEFTAIVPIETIERVKKIRDYGFVHFNTRDNALKCMKALNGKLLDGAPMEVTLAKPVDRETYVRYTRANNRAPTEAPDALPPQFPGFVTAAYDPRLDPAAAAAAAYYPGGPIYFGGIPSYAAAPLPAIQQVPRYPMPAFRGAGVAPVSHMGMAQIGAAGVPLGIPGATTGVATAPGGRGATGGRGGGRNRSHNQSRSVAGGGGGGGGRNYVNVGGQRGFQTTYYNQYNRRPTWQPPHHQQQQQVISVQQAPAEKYDLQPGMELTPINPLSLKPNQQKSSVQLLEEYCMKVGLEKPAYKLHSTPGPTGQQLFLYRVELLNSNSRLRQSTLPQPVESPQPQQVTKQQPSNSPKQQLDSQYTPTKLCTSLDMAQEIAAEHVLTTLQGSSAPEANDHNGEVYVPSDSLQSMTLYNGAASGEADPQSGYNAGYTVYSNVPYAGGIVTTYG